MEHFAFVWDYWHESDESDNEELVIERRAYSLTLRVDHFNKWDDTDFFIRFRLRKEVVANILNLIRPSLLHNTDRQRSIPPMAQLLITLRFYALGSMLLSVGDFSGVSKSSVSNIVQKVSSAIALLRKDFIKMPQTDEELHEASKSFYDMNKFPKTIGAIDCTYVKIQSPGGANAEYFRNRKGIFSLNVQTVSSADLKVMNVVARWPGSCHDQTIFNNSKLKMQLENNFYKGYILIADSGYANTSYMATPLLECHNPVEQLYNECIIRTRNVVERLFGVWKRRFPVLSLGMRLKMETVQDIVVATAVLHNIAVDLNDGVPPTLHEDMENVLANESFELNRIEDDRFENVRLKLLSNYFPALLRENEA